MINRIQVLNTNIVKFFRRQSSLDYLTPPLKDSVKLSYGTSFYFKLKFLVENLKNYPSEVFDKGK